MKLVLLLLLSTFGVSSVAHSASSSGKNRFFQVVMKMDTVSNVWRLQHAQASVKVTNDKLFITIWNHWGVEHINPIFRITIDNKPKWNDAEEKWLYGGVIRRSAGGPERDCTVETPTIIENTKDIEFTVVSSDFVGRYQIIRKKLRKR